jgi:hypothetical protein
MGGKTGAGAGGSSDVAAVGCAEGIDEFKISMLAQKGGGCKSVDALSSIENVGPGGGDVS